MNNPFYNEETGTFDREGMQRWLGENQSWLSTWLFNVIVVQSSQTDQTSHMFQRFKLPVNHDQFPNMLSAVMVSISMLDQHLMMQAVFGQEKKNPPSFPGFLYTVGRLPEQGDQAVFTALEWHVLKPDPEQRIISGVPKRIVMETYCSVDYILKEQIKNVGQ